jgi:hypothetical protein
LGLLDLVRWIASFLAALYFYQPVSRFGRTAVGLGIGLESAGRFYFDCRCSRFADSDCRELSAQAFAAGRSQAARESVVWERCRVLSTV